MTKYVFVDIDGTLLDHVHGVPKSAVTAIQTARLNGHKVFICTGRARSDISPFIEAIGFDGFICASGAHVEVDGQVLLEAHLDPECVHSYLHQLETIDVDCVLESSSGLYCSQGAYNFLTNLYASFSKEHPEYDDANARPAHLSLLDAYVPTLHLVNKITLFSQSLHLLQAFSEDCPKGLRVLIYDKALFGYHNGEIQLATVNKASGIQVVLNHFNAHQKDTLGLGDSANDVEMIDFCEVGIAMGDAVSYLKEAANYVTTSVMEDGIWKAFKAQGLI